MMTITEVRIYRSAGQWCYTAVAGTEHDHGDTLPDAATEADARAAVAALWPTVTIRRVPDVDRDGQVTP